MKIARKILSVINLLIIFFTTLAVYATQWLRATYGNISFDEILFTLSAPIRGTEGSLIDSFKRDALKPAVIITLVIFILLTILYSFFASSSFKIKIQLFKHKIHEFRISGLIPFFLLVVLNIGTIAATLNNCMDEVGIKEYYFNQTQNSTFIADNYVNPNDVTLTFPEQKRNLIHIYVESFETSYFSKEFGGQEDVNLLDELVKLTSDNINFSDTDKFGGAYVSSGADYTTAGLTAQMLGIPIKLGKELIGLDEHHDSFLPGATGIGDILEENGYRQYFMMGSFKGFGNRDTLLTDHGNYQIYDLTSAHRDGSLPEGYRVYWGFEDSKLFSFAKKQLTEIAKDNTPFNYSFLTENTHATEGYMESSCPQKYSEQYSNVISCTAGQILDFVSWIQKQDFYKNTTIVITGDHLTMNNTHFAEDTLANRRLYNLFINPAVKPKQSNNRKFTSMDIFPTTLAAMGVKIEGNRLALGTNLFSNEKTLLEKYSIEEINAEIDKRSIFYNDKFLLGK